MTIFYGNSALNQLIGVTYNDITHAVTGGASFGAITTEDPLIAGTEIYQQIDSGTVYSVRVSNGPPYAYVVSYPEPTCSIVINSLTPTNASTDFATNGQILANVTGNGVITYSLDGGPQQSSNLFTNVAPGVHVVTVYNNFFGVICTSSQSVTVGYSALSDCDLALGQVIQTASPGGTITVIDYTTKHTEPVEYRLDSGAWQSSNLFTGLAAATYSLQIRFKNFTSCTASRSIVISAGAPCTAVLSAAVITHEQTPYGNNGTIKIIGTTGAAPLTYSKDNGSNYQAGDTFYNLAPGAYTLKIKDANNCTATLVVAVLKYKIPYLTWPQACSLRVVNTSGPLAGGLPNFDNTLFLNQRVPNVAPCQYFQKFLTTDLFTYQFRSSYDVNTCKLYNMAGTLQASLAVVKKSSNMGYSDSRTANFSDAGAGKTQVWFASEMPTFYEIGQTITVTGLAGLNGSYIIEDIKPGTLVALGNIVFIISKVYPGGGDPLNATVAVTYNIQPYEVYEAVIDCSVPAAGQYYFRFEGSDSQFAAYGAQSEPIETYQAANLIEHLKITFKNIDNGFNVDYSTAIQHLLRVEGRLLQAAPGGDSEVMEDSNRRLIKLRENVTRMVQMDVYDVPPYLAEKIIIALAHDTITVDNVAYQTSEKPNYAPFEMIATADVSAKLRQVDFIAENTDDTASPVDGSAVLGVNGGLLAVQP